MPAEAIGGPTPWRSFGVGAVIPTLILLGYNQLAFGSPWDMGYVHHAIYQFAKVHNAANPLGLRLPNWSGTGCQACCGGATAG